MNVSQEKRQDRRVASRKARRHPSARCCIPIRTSLGYPGAVAAALLVSGCSGSPDAPGGSAARATNDVGEVRDEILGGTTLPNGQVSVVAILTAEANYCSGILLNRFTVLTAAHCFPSIQGGQTQDMFASVVYRQPVGSSSRTFCLTSDGDMVNPAGYPVCNLSANYHVSVYPGYVQGSKDAATDLAVMKSAKAFLTVTPADYAIINAGSLRVNPNIYGWGDNSQTPFVGMGTLRVGTATLDSISPQHILLRAGAARGCTGDSGGPAAIPPASIKSQLVVEGLGSSVETARLGDNCAVSGGIERYTRLSPKIDFIQNASGIKCRKITGSNGNPTYQCWYPTIAIRAKVNGKYVTAEDAGASPLIARASSVGAWERFELIDNFDGTTSFVSQINNLAVTAEDAGASPLIARAGAIGSWEEFRRVVSPSDGTIQGFIAVNGNFVTAEDAGASPLIARASAMGLWEQFQIEFQ